MFEVAGVVARLGFKVDDDGANRFERKIRGLREDTRKPVVAPLKAEIQGNELDLYARKLEELQAKTRRRDAFRAQLGADFDPKAFNAYDRELRRVEKSTRDVQRSSGDANASVAQLGVTMRKMFDSTAKIGSVGLAAQGLSAVGAGGAAAVAGLAPVAGALAAYPALATAAGQGLGVVKLATAGVTQAVGGLNEELDRNSKAFKHLTPEGQKFAIQLDKMKAPLRELATTAQRGLVPGIETGLRSAIRNVDVLERGVGRTSKVLGGLAGDAGRLLGTRGFGKDLETQMRRNDVTIRRAGEGGLNLANALRHVVIEAGPLVNWMTRLGLKFTEVIEKQAKAGRESGALGRFFEQTRIQASRLIRIGTDLGAALINIGKAAYPLGNDLLGSLTKTVAKFREWTDSAGGQNAIKKYFADARPAIYEAAKLIRDLGGAFLRLGRGDQIAPLLRTVRTQLVPAVETMFQSTTKQFMPAFLRFATEAIKLFTHLAGTSGPLVSLTKLLGTLAAGLNNLLDRFPVLNTAVVSLVALGGIAKALKLASAITGVGTLIGLLRKAKTTAAGVALAEGAAARGGAGAGAVRGGAAAGALGALGGPAGLAVAGTTIVVIAGQANKASRDQRAADAVTGISGQLGQLAKTTPRDYERVRDVIDKVRKGLQLTRAENDLWTRSLHRAGIEGRTSFLKLMDSWSDVRKAAQKTFKADQFKDWQAHVKATVNNADRQWTNLSKNTGTSMKDIRQTVQTTGRFIRSQLGTETHAAGKAVHDNFKAAADAIRDQMARGKIETKEGARLIRQYTISGLKALGLTQGQAESKIDRGTIQTRRGPQADAARGGYIRRATGGWIGGRGLVSGDVVPIAPGVMAALGEYDAQGPGDRRAVLNRHQAPFAEMALAAGGYPGLDQLPAGRQLPIIERALGAFGGLDRLFQTVNRPHYLAKGGIVPVPGFPGEQAAAGVIPMIEFIARRFGLVLTDAFGPGHESPGHTRFGTAADFAGSDAGDGPGRPVPRRPRLPRRLRRPVRLAGVARARPPQGGGRQRAPARRTRRSRRRDDRPEDPRAADEHAGRRGRDGAARLRCHSLRRADRREPCVQLAAEHTGRGRRVGRLQQAGAHVAVAARERRARQPEPDGRDRAGRIRRAGWCRERPVSRAVAGRAGRVVQPADQRPPGRAEAPHPGTRAWEAYTNGSFRQFLGGGGRVGLAGRTISRAPAACRCRASR
jgi:hypothetical protein